MKTLFIALIIAVTLGTAVVAEAAPQTVKVGVNKEKAIGKTRLRVKFVEFIEDSRCPVDVDCIWAGNAKIKVRVTSRGVSRVLTLDTMGSEKPIVAHGYKFRLTGLTPVPRSNVRIDPSKYIATVEAEKLGK
jgi:hypothetical protein